MPDDVKEVQPTPAPKPKPSKTEKVRLKLTRAGSCNYDGIFLKKNETVELEASQAEQLMQSGLFDKL